MFDDSSRVFKVFERSFLKSEMSKFLYEQQLGSYSNTLEVQWHALKTDKDYIYIGH